MTQYRNETLGVVNVGGVFIAPGKAQEVSDKAPGIQRLIKRGVLAKAGTRKTQQAEQKKPDQGGDTKQSGG